jgi:hypothetical protein
MATLTFLGGAGTVTGRLSTKRWPVEIPVPGMVAALWLTAYRERGRFGSAGVRERIGKVEVRKGADVAQSLPRSPNSRAPCESS